MKDNQINQKLFSWINGIININDPAMRREFVPLWDLINNTVKNGADEITSTIKIDNRSFKLHIGLIEEINRDELHSIKKSAIKDDDIEPIVSIDQLEKIKK